MNRADDTTPRASVPADIDAPDTIVWGLTFRQLAILAVAAGAGYGIHRAVGHLLPPMALLIAGIPLAGVVVAVALGRRDGRSMDAWLASALRLRRTPRLQAPAGTAPASAGLVAVTGALTPPAPLRLPADAITDTGLLHIADAHAAVVAAGRQRDLDDDRYIGCGEIEVLRSLDQLDLHSEREIFEALLVGLNGIHREVIEGQP